MTPLLFYLNATMFDKEVEGWWGSSGKRRWWVSPTPCPTISQWSAPMETSGVGPSTSKRNQTPSISEEEANEGEEEAISRDTIQIPFSSIPDNATISGKKF
jgi:hypothetical protein